LNKKIDFLILICAGSIINTLVVCTLWFLFRDPQVPPSVMPLRVGLPGLGFIVLSTLLMGTSARLFDSANFKTTGEAYNRALKKIGTVPLKMIALLTVLENVLLAALFMQGSAVGIPPGMGTTLYLVCLSLGLLVGTFIYVLTDQLVSKTLIANALTKYPRDLREGRQSIKMLIIPIVVTIIAILYNLSAVLLVLARAGGSIQNLNGGYRAALSGLIGFLVLVVFALALTLKKSTSSLFNAVIVQLENLSSDKKDLTRRISICSVDEVGTIAGMVNSFCENMESGIRDIKGGQGHLSASGLKLEENSSGMASSLDRISGAVEQVRKKTEEQMHSVTESSAAVQQISKNIESLDNSISTQAASVTQASAAVEEMIGNINSIGTVTEKMAAQFKTVGDAAAAGGAIQQESGGRINEIVGQPRPCRRRTGSSPPSPPRPTFWP
jgi:methyl-accepting chemotaxis protein